MFKKTYYFLTITFCLIALSACDKATESTPSKAADSITVMNAHIRALPPGSRVTAMYMQLKNESANNHDLVSIEGDISSMIELHTHTNNNGVMQMGEVESIPLPANATAEAKSGSYHVMIMGLQKDVKVGEKYNFNFMFKDGSSLPVTAEVKTIDVN